MPRSTRKTIINHKADKAESSLGKLTNFLDTFYTETTNKEYLKVILSAKNVTTFKEFAAKLDDSLEKDIAQLSRACGRLPASPDTKLILSP
jgi:hypothetical protein